MAIRTALPVRAGAVTPVDRNHDRRRSRLPRSGAGRARRARHPPGLILGAAGCWRPPLLALVVALPVLLTGGNALAQTPIDAEQFCMRTKDVRSAILAEVPGATATCTKASPDAVPPVDAVYLTNLTTEQLAGVWTLDFRDADLSIFADGDFDGLTGLTKLNLSKNWFRVGPADAGVPLSVLGQLEELYIANNNLIRVGIITADFFRGLHNLRILDLERNNLKYDRSVKHLATGAFRNLTNLRTLKIGSNRLLTLPKGMFEGLSNLEVLDMFTQRYEWPDIGFGTEPLEAGIFEGLSNLKKLDLGYNAFGAASVDERIFEGLSSLEVLDLRHNPLTVLPQSVLSLPSTVWIRTDSDVAYPPPPEDPPSTTSFPEVSIAAGSDSVEEGDPATFTLSRTDPAAALTVTVSVTESGAMLSGAPPETVAFGAGESARTLSVATDDDAVVEAASTVTAVVVAASGYRVAPGAASAEVEVEDDDAATFDVTVNPAEIAEGEASTVTVAITNGVTFAADQAIALEFTGSTAAKGADFVVSPETLTLVAGQGTVTATVTAVDDSGEESAETIAVAASHAGTQIGTATVTISANDAPANGLTASFKNLPATHDGSSEFTFQVEFSEDVGISYAVLRDDGFTVTGGDVTGARRVNGRNDLWEITVKPDGQGDVSITLPGNRDCGTTGAVCTRGENPRPLSNSPSATVAGPPAAVTPTVGISDASGTEGDGDIAFTVTLDSTATDTVTVDYATSNGTADDDDYTATSGTLTFDAGTISGTITVPIADDDVNESDETFTVTLSNASGAVLGTASATGTIENRYVTPAVSISDAGGTEGDGDIAFTVTLDSAASATVTVDYATANGTADGDDYTATSGTLTFAAGTTSGTIIVPIADDNENESDETFTVTLSNASGAVLGTASATGTIRNRHVTPAVSISDAGGTEGDGDIAFTVTLDSAASATVTVDYATANGTADGDDYTATSGTLTFAAGTTSGTVTVPIADDNVNESDETFTVTLSNASGATLGTASATGTIQNRYVTPAVSISDAGGTEGDGDIAFTVTLDSAATATVTVDYATSDGTADAGDDYTATSGTLTFAAGTTSGTVTVPIADDNVNESDETFTVTLSNASGATLGTASATGTIRDTETAAELSADFPESAFTSKRHTGSDDRPQVVVAFSEAVAEFAVNTPSASVTGASGLSVQPHTEDGLENAYIFFMTPDGDGDVTFALTTNAACAAGGICTAGGTMLAQVPAAWTIPGPGGGSSSLSVADAEATEEGDGTMAFVVTLDPAARDTVTVDYATSDGSAQAGDDYTATSGTLTFDAGTTSGTITVPIADDDENETDETFTVTLSNASGATLGTASATGTIRNRYVTPLTASFEQVPAEHDGTTFVFHVRFSEDPAVSYLVLKEESFDVTGGKVDKARRRDGRNDLREIHVEPSGNGDVTVSLPPPTDCNADGAICTADGRPLSNANSVTVRGMAALSVADAQTTEGAGATLEFAVTLSRAASGTVTVGYATSDGTAVAGSDYTSASGTLTFDPGETAGTVSVTVLDDSVDDDGETLTLTLSNASGARLDDAEATGTINNADPVPLAWLVRFGRAASDHAVEAIGARFEDAGGGAHATFAGRRLWDGGDAIAADPWGGANGADPFGMPPNGFGAGGGFGGSGPGAFGGNAPENAGMNARMNGGGMDAGMTGGPNGVIGMNTGTSGGPPGGIGMNAGTNGGAALGPPDAGGYRPALRDLLIGSSFLLSASGADEAGASRRLTAWGRAAATRFDGVAEGVSVDGEVATFLIGADAAWNRWLAGVSVAYSVGAGGFDGVDGSGGELDSALTAVHPYLRYRLSDRISAWGVLGYGTGELNLQTDGSAWETDTSMRMAAAGARGVLLRGDGGFELAAKTDVRLTHIASDAAEGAAGLLGATAGGTSRLRLLLEGSRPFSFGPMRTLTPTLQLGVRRDGGDAETGAGFDLGGSLRYADAALGLTVEAAGRYLLAHEDAAYKEWGASVSVRVDPGASGHGLTLSVTPSWGADAAGGAERLWSVRDARGLAGQGFDTAMRLRAEVGYGLSAFRGRGAAMPFAGVSTTVGGRDWRAGARWTRGRALEMSLEAVRRESAGAAPEHGIEFRLAWRPGTRGPARGAADRLAEAAGDEPPPTAADACPACGDTAPGRRKAH